MSKTVKKKVKCPHCSGTGVAGYISSIRCPDCKGNKYLIVEEPVEPEEEDTELTEEERKRYYDPWGFAAYYQSKG